MENRGYAEEPEGTREQNIKRNNVGGGLSMDKKEVRITSIKPSTLAMFEGVFGLIVGLVVSIAYWIRATIGFTQSTNSLLQGLMLGLGAGILAVIALAIIYFITGWIVGYIQGVVFNIVASWMGGIEFGTRQVDEYGSPAASTSGQSSRRAEPSFGETINRRH
jgi:hypothetical protein